MQREFDRHTRYGEPASLVMFDIDHFKRINDSLGHIAGDRVIQHLSHILSQNLRETDCAGRYGGEEFILLLPGLTLEQAAQLAEQIRSAVWSLNIPHHTPSGRVTISLGVASAIPSREDRMESLIRDADSALYQAKEQGRDRVSLWPAPQ